MYDASKKIDEESEGEDDYFLHKKSILGGNNFEDLINRAMSQMSPRDESGSRGTFELNLYNSI